MKALRLHPRATSEQGVVGSLAKNAALFTGLAITCLLLAGALTGTIGVPVLSSLPPIAIAAVVALAAATPALLTQWRVSFWIFICWLMVEDLIRKFAGNSLGVFGLKGIIFVVLVVGLLLDPEVRGSWRRAAGPARVALYVLVSWAFVMSVPSLFIDLKLPFLGLGANFAFVPLVVAGYCLSREPESLRNLLMWVAVITAVTAFVGIVQAIIGPSFLSPNKVTPGLQNLVTIRWSATVQGVFRPTGTFVDPGRYASLAFVSLAVSLAAAMVLQGKRRLLSFACAAIAVVGIWVSGGRTPVILGLVLIVVAAVVPRAEAGRRSFLLAISMGLLVFVGLFVLVSNSPDAFRSRLAFYSDTLDPSRGGSEWATRWENYTSNIFRGAEEGGLIGLGTGAESVGKQYFFTKGSRVSAGQYLVESGYGSLLIEWGVIGLSLWVIWVWRWLGRQVRSVRRTRAGPLRSGGAVLVTWSFLFLVVEFFAGIAAFQNYIANAFFWLFSGIVFGLCWADPAETSHEEWDARPYALTAEVE